MEGITDGWNLNFPLYVLIEIRVFKILYPEPGKTKRMVEMKKIRFFVYNLGGDLENLRMQSAHLSPGRFWLPSILNLNSRLCTLYSLSKCHLTCPQTVLGTMMSKELEQYPVTLSNEQASGVGNVEK